MDWNYIIRILIVIIAVIVVTVIASKNRGWYFSGAVSRPPQEPPGIVFGIVWTLLYIIYAYVWCVAYKKANNTAGIDILFAVSLFLNVLWVIVFFGWHNLFLSKVVILLLLATVLLQAYVMWELGSGVCTFLLLVYGSWLLVASLLNFNTRINPCYEKVHSIINRHRTY